MSDRAADSSFPIPDGFGLTQVVLHYEAEDLTADPDPFAGNVVVQLRLDVEPEEDLPAVAARDLQDLKNAFGSFQSKKSGDNAASPLTSLEFGFDDGDGRALEQVILYGRRGEHVYTVTGTHVRGARFMNVRSAAIALAREMLGA